MTQYLLSFGIASIFAAIGVLHFYWAADGTTGLRFAIPTKDGLPAFRPSPGLTVLVGLALLCAGALVAMAGRIIPSPMPDQWIKVLMYGLAVVFLARTVGDFHWFGVFKKVTNSDFSRADTFFHTPLCLALALGILVINRGVST